MYEACSNLQSFPKIKTSQHHIPNVLLWQIKCLQFHWSLSYQAFYRLSFCSRKEENRCVHCLVHNRRTNIARTTSQEIKKLFSFHAKTIRELETSGGLWNVFITPESNKHWEHFIVSTAAVKPQEPTLQRKWSRLKSLQQFMIQRWEQRCIIVWGNASRSSSSNSKLQNNSSSSITLTFISQTTIWTQDILFSFVHLMLFV